MEDIKLESLEFLTTDSKSKDLELKPKILCGYDGFSGVHDNLKWILVDGQIIYTMNNKIVFENTKTRVQTIITQSQVRFSTLAISEDGKTIAVAEGEANQKGQAQILLIDITDKENKEIKARLNGHTKGVQSLAFSKDDKFLISLSVDEEKSVIVWRLETNSQLTCAELERAGGNMILADPTSNEEILIFFVLGHSGILYKYEYKVLLDEIQATNCLNTAQMQLYASTDFVCGVFTHSFGKELDYLAILILGTSDGKLMALKGKEFMHKGKPHQMVDHGQIGSIQVNKENVVIATHLGQIIRYKLTPNIFPMGLKNEMFTALNTNLDGCITAMEFEKNLNEGIVGTSQGSIYYVNLNMQQVLKIVSRINPTIDKPMLCQFDRDNQFFMCTTGERSGDVKLYSEQMVDELYKIQQKGCGKVVFILQLKKPRQMVGHADGSIKIIDFKTFDPVLVYKFDLKTDEELTVCAICPKTINFAVGTTLGEVFLCSIKPEKDIFAVRLSGVKREEISTPVTGILLSSFDPEGSMVVAFSNGEVRTWQAQVAPEVMKTVKGKKNIDIDELQEFVFKITDQFDVHEAEYGYHSTSKDFDGRCQISFEPGSKTYDKYLCYHSSLKRIFIRNSFSKFTKTINLTYQPISIDCLPRSILADYGLAGGPGIVIGTQEGFVLLYYLSDRKDRLLAKSKPGQMFGEVTAVAFKQDHGEVAVAISSMGEIMTFDASAVFRESGSTD